MVGRSLRETLVIINVCSILVQAEDFLELYVPRPEYPIQLNNWLSAVQDHKHDFDSIKQAAMADRRMKKRDLLNLALDTANVDDDLEGLDKQPTNDIYPYMYRTNTKSTKKVTEMPESRDNLYQRTLRSPLRLRRDSYRADLEKISNVDVKSKGSAGEMKRSGSKYPERYVRSKSDDNKDINFKRKRDIQIDVLSDGKLLKEIKNVNGDSSVVLNIQSVADTHVPDASTFSTENSQFKDIGANTDLKSLGNVGRAEKQLVASSSLSRVKGNKETNFRNKNDIVSYKSGESGIIKQSPDVEKLKESDPNFKNLFNENEKLNTDISIAKDKYFPSTISPMEVTNTANIIQQQPNAANELRQNPQSALKYYSSFTNNGLQDMSRFWSPTEKSLMEAGIQIAQRVPDSKSEIEGFEEVTSMVINNKGINTNKKYPNKRQLDDYASKVLGEGYFVKENDVVRQLTDLPEVSAAEGIVVNEIPVYTNEKVPTSTTKEQINSIQKSQEVLNTDELNSHEGVFKSVEDLSDTVHGHEEVPESAGGQNEKVLGTLTEENPLPQNNKDMPNSVDDQNTINSNVEVAIAPIQQYDSSHIRSTEPEIGSVETCTHIRRKDKFFIGHQVVTEIETVKELEPNIDSSKDTVNMLMNIKDNEKEAETNSEGIKSELASKQEDTERNEEISPQFEKTTHFEENQQLGTHAENNQPGIDKGSLETSMQHKETFNERQGAIEGENVDNVEQQNHGIVQESHKVASKHEKLFSNGHSDYEMEGKENPEHHHSGPIKGIPEETAIKDKNNPDMKNMEYKHYETVTDQPKQRNQMESSEVETDHGSDESRSMEHTRHGYSGPIVGDAECTDVEDIDDEYFEEKPNDNTKHAKIVPGNQEDAENQNMGNSEHQNFGVVEETVDNKLQKGELEKYSKKHDRIGDHYSSHLDEAGREEGFDNIEKGEEASDSDDKFETESQLELKENIGNGRDKSNRHHHPLKEEKEGTENHIEENYQNHHHHGHSGDVEDERDIGKKQHGGTQIIVINNAGLKDEIEAKSFLLPQTRMKKEKNIDVTNERISKKKSDSAKFAGHSNREKFVRQRRKKKHYLYLQQEGNDGRPMEKSGFEYKNHFMERKLKKPEQATKFRSSYDGLATYDVIKRNKEASKLESEHFPIEEVYMGRKLKETADYIYDPSIEKPEEEYDADDSTDKSDVTEKRERKIKGAVEGDYGDEEDSMTEQKKAGKKMIKNTKNEFAHPRTTTEAADDDDYYEEIEGMGKKENIHYTHGATREDVKKGKKAIIGRKAQKKAKKLKHAESSKAHAAKTNQNRMAFREPRLSDYSKTNPEFQHWPKFMISDQENEEKLRKRSLVTKKPAKRNRQQFKESMKNFFLKPAPKKRFDMESIDVGGSSTARFGEKNMKTYASEKEEAFSDFEGIANVTAAVGHNASECLVNNKTTTVNATGDASTACAEEVLNSTRPELSTVLSILDQKELQSEMAGKFSEMPKLDDILDGRLPSMIRDEILDQVKTNKNLKRFQTARRISKIHILNQTDTSSEETKKLLHYMTQIIERLQFATTCQVLSPRLSYYLRDLTNVPRDDALKRLRDMEEIQLDENQNDPNNNYLFRAHAPMDKLEDKAKLLEELLEKYNKLPDQCKPRAEPVREYIENHLGLVNKMLSGQETSKKSVRRAKDSESSKPESKKSEDLVEQQLEGLGLGKSKSFKPKFDLDELVARHRRQKSILFEDEEEYTSDKKPYDVQEDCRTVSNKYKKLLNAIEQEKKRDKRDQTLARVYGVPNLDYYNESPKEKREASSYNFETPLVYSL